MNIKSKNQPIWRSAALFLLTLSLSAGATAGERKETRKIAEILDLERGDRVADVGAGDGEFSVRLAKTVGDSGHVYATEVNTNDLESIRELVAEEGLTNVSVIHGEDTDSGLSADCCDAILLRLVYHHFTHPREMLTSLRSALTEDGKLAIIDIVPQEDWHRLDGVPERDGHGIDFEDLREELESAGWTLVDHHQRWIGDSDRFCAVFSPS